MEQRACRGNRNARPLHPILDRPCTHTVIGLCPVLTKSWAARRLTTFDHFFGAFEDLESPVQVTCMTNYDDRVCGQGGFSRLHASMVCVTYLWFLIWHLASGI